MNKEFYAVFDARYQIPGREDRAVCLLATDDKQEAIDLAKEHGKGTTVAKCFGDGKTPAEDIFIA